MNKLLFAVLIAGAINCSAASKPKKHNDYSPEKIAELNAQMMEAQGGCLFIQGKGKTVFYNYQNKVPLTLVKDRAGRIGRSTQSTVVVAEKNPEYSGVLPVLPEDATLGVFIVDRKDLPMSIVSIENHWGVVNVAKLGDDPAKLEKRFCKELSRIASVVMSGAVSQTASGSLQTVSRPEDLDAIVSEGIAFDTLQLISRNFKKLGVTSSRRISYRKACREGIAPNPTNDIQKAIWEEVHALPTNPLPLTKPTK